jgi:hypothetical protein
MGSSDSFLLEAMVSSAMQTQPKKKPTTNPPKKISADICCSFPGRLIPLTFKISCRILLQLR